MTKQYHVGVALFFLKRKIYASSISQTSSDLMKISNQTKLEKNGEDTQSLLCVMDTSQKTWPTGNNFWFFDSIQRHTWNQSWKIVRTLWKALTYTQWTEGAKITTDSRDLFDGRSPMLCAFFILCVFSPIFGFYVFDFFFTLFHVVFG